jgi:hypothetical protein
MTLKMTCLDPCLDTETPDLESLDFKNYTLARSIFQQEMESPNLYYPGIMATTAGIIIGYMAAGVAVPVVRPPSWR